MAQGGLSPFIYQRVAENVVAAERRRGYRAVHLLVHLPVRGGRPPFGRYSGAQSRRSDDRESYLLGSHIGIGATAPTTLKPTTELVQSKAAARKLEVKIDAPCCARARSPPCQLATRRPTTASSAKPCMS